MGVFIHGLLRLIRLKRGVVMVQSVAKGDVPASSEDAILQSSESLESSSSNLFLPFSSSWYDGNNYNLRACCADTVYIEDGMERVHMSDFKFEDQVFGLQ